MADNYDNEEMANALDVLPINTNAADNYNISEMGRALNELSFGTHKIIRREKLCARIHNGQSRNVHVHWLFDPNPSGPQREGRYGIDYEASTRNSQTICS